MAKKDYWIIFSLLVFTFFIRFPALTRIAFLHDEIIVIQAAVRSLDFAVERGYWWEVLIDIPLRFSAAVTPLWNWLQYIVTLLLPVGEHPTRLLPFACSFLPIILSYYLTAQYFTRRIAIGTAIAFAISDICLWTSTKSEFTEQLLVSCMLSALIFMLRKNKRDFFIGSMLLGIAPLTYLGKGIFIYALYLLWLTGGSFLKRYYWRHAKANTFRDLVYYYGVLGISLIPTIVWLFAAFYRIGLIQSTNLKAELGQIQSFSMYIYHLTVGIFKTRSFMQGYPGSNFIIYSYLEAWPTSTMMTPLALLGIISSLINLSKNNFSKSHELFLVMAVLGYVPFLYFTLNGYQGARYTLLYHYPFALSFALGIQTLITWFDLSLKNRIKGYLVIFIILCYAFLMIARVSYVVLMFDWTLFWSLVLYGGGGFLISSSFIEYLFLSTKRMRLRYVSLFIFFMALTSITTYYFYCFGPNYWGKFQGWGVEENNVKTFESRLFYDKYLTNSPVSK
ncbi:MAG: hypothetical protein GY797_38000 [Deltaproteobacteria bacterium]|nr:hypothetical protein [Deltaproteobacteria bacterium]